jgi:hypothetical protein
MRTHGVGPSIGEGDQHAFWGTHRGQAVTQETVEQYRQLGVGMLLMPQAYHSDLPALLEHLEQFKDTVIRPADRAAGRVAGD